jgi:hypothetical protein
MFQFTSEHTPLLALPQIRCPRCGTNMRLSQITPGPTDRYEIKFDCECGFDYEMSACVVDEKQRQ